MECLASTMAGVAWSRHELAREARCYRCQSWEVGIPLPPGGQKIRNESQMLDTELLTPLNFGVGML